VWLCASECTEKFSQKKKECTEKSWKGTCSLATCALPTANASSRSADCARHTKVLRISMSRVYYEINPVPLSSSPVRIPGFHPDDPGSNPGNGTIFIILRQLLGYWAVFRPPKPNCISFRSSNTLYFFSPRHGFKACEKKTMCQRSSFFSAFLLPFVFNGNNHAIVLIFIWIGESITITQFLFELNFKTLSLCFYLFNLYRSTIHD
jgi:hypothetical protein